MFGLGRIQTRVRRAFYAYPERVFYTEELAEWAYPRLKGPLERKHRWAIVRAAKRVAVRDGRDYRGVRFKAPAAPYKPPAPDWLPWRK